MMYNKGASSMRKDYHALHIGEKEAIYCYSAMPNYFKAEYSQEAFAQYIEDLLKEAGDIEDWQFVTELGKSHGFYQTSGCSGEYNENGRMIFHSQYPMVSCDQVGEAYIVELLKQRFPEFDESHYLQYRRQIDINRRSSIVEGDDCYKNLPPEFSDFLKCIICNEIDNPYIFINCDYEDESDIIELLRGYEWVYYDKKDIIAMSGKQIAVNLQCDLLRGAENALSHFLVDNHRFAIIIDRIEDITKYIQEQKYLPKLLSFIVNCGVKIIILSEHEPLYIFGMSQELHDLFNYSCYYFNARGLCRAKKNPGILDDNNIDYLWKADLQNYERNEYRLKEDFASLPF